MRQLQQLNDNWYFCKNIAPDMEIPMQLPDGEDKAWERVTLPHTWNAVDGQDGGNDYFRGSGIYVRKINRHITQEECAFLEVNAAAMSACVYANGKKIAIHEGGYSCFRVDITEYLRGECVLTIVVDNSENDRIYPQKADFTFYGGLYRGVNLIVTKKSHFELEKDGTKGIRITPKVDLAAGRAAVTIEAWVKCAKDAENTSVSFLVRGEEEYTVKAAVQDGYTKAELTIRNVRLWKGIADPYLYTLKAELFVDGRRTDCVSERFGCRTIGFDPERGFLLNGSPCALRGVSRHQDREGVGNALTIEMHREDMELIKEIGANSVRLAHYQHAQEFYDLCDEYGMVVWAEIPYITKHMPNGRENTISQMKELVTQCYHHPSIVCWGLSNEITAAGTVSDDMVENHILLNDLCHTLDPTRPTTMAHVFMLETDSPMTQIADLGCYNLYFGWYLGELGQNDSFFDEYHAKYPKRCIGFSEYGADANLKFQTADPERGDYTEQYQALYHEHILSCIEKRPYLWSTYVWNMFDFGADGRDEGGAHGRNQKGLVTMDRKTKKDAFYLYKAYWSSEPFLHLCGRRYVERAEEETDVKIYTNQRAVTLYLDGTKIGYQESDTSHIFEFRVPISGIHKIEAVSGACRDEIEICKVTEPKKEYLFQKEEIVNWFNKEDVNPDYLSVMDTMGEIMASEKGAPLLEKIMAKARASRGDVAQSAFGNIALQKMMAGMKLQSVLKQAGEAITPKDIKDLNAALQQIKK